MTNGRNGRADDYRLSPKQATALRRVSRSPWSIESAQHILQTTLGALYKRQYIRIEGGYFNITTEGEEALKRQSHSDIERSRTMYGAGFAQAIGELASYGKQKNKKVREMPRRQRSAA